MQDDVLAQATAAIKLGSKSFSGASRLFDRRTRTDTRLLYAWCRHCDDVIDGQVLGGRNGDVRENLQDKLERLRAHTIAACNGETVHEPAFAGLALVVARNRIPARYPLAHLDGFAMDAAGRAYTCIEETLDYCYHVAGVVGVMMALVMGVREEAVLDRAADLGIAFQLTNIARDVVDDARVGRVYLPADWLEQAGLDRARLEAAAGRPALAAVTERLLATAEPYYESARVGLLALPARSAWAIATALMVYRAIGRKVRARGPAAWDQRVSTTKWEKLAYALAASLPAAQVATFGQLRAAPPRPGLWRRPG